MKTFAKKTMALLIAVMASGAVANASNDEPVTTGQLPVAAQKTLKTYFGGKKIALSTVDVGVFNKTYGVIFTDGDKVEFDRKGEWKEVSRRSAAVPSGLVPEQIRSYVKSHYPNAKIVEIERERREYEVKLDNRIELTFDKSFRLTDIDN